MKKYKKTDVGHAARFLQNELNAILHSFVNGGFSYKGFALYPLVKDVSKENITKIKKLKETAVFLENNGYDFSNSLSKYEKYGAYDMNKMKRINSKNFALILSSLYGDFSLIKNDDAIAMKKPKCEEFDISDYEKNDLKYLKPLNDLKDYANKNLKQYLLGFYIHGSFATKDYIKGFSDVDTLSVISCKTIDNPDALLELRKKIYFMRYFFYQMDPLQHHGSIIISEYDLKNYCQAYFPVQIFKYVKSFFKEDAIQEFRVRDFSSESLEELFWFVNYFRKLSTEKKFNLGSYETKTLLHSVTLFPTIYLAAKGILVYKKFSFDIAKKDFSRQEWKAIETVSSIRSCWKELKVIPMTRLSSKLNPLLQYQLNSRIVDLFADAKKINRIDVKSIVNDMHRLSESAWSKVNQNAKRKK